MNRITDEQIREACDLLGYVVIGRRCETEEFSALSYDEARNDLQLNAAICARTLAWDETFVVLADLGINQIPIDAATALAVQPGERITHLGSYLLAHHGWALCREIYADVLHTKMEG